MSSLPEIEPLLQDAAQTRSFSGVVLVAMGGRVAHAFTAGLANRPWSVPNKLDTRFRIASIEE